MERSDVYYQFVQRYPESESLDFEINSDRVCEIRVGVLRGLVEEAFVGVYLRNGDRCMEQRIQEQDMVSALGTRSIQPEAAIELALEYAKRFTGRP